MLGALSYQVNVPPALGTLVFNTDGTFSYTPPVDFSGQITFEYVACDTSDVCDTAVVTILVWPINDSPLAVDDNYTITEGNTLEDDVMVNDTDDGTTELTIDLIDDVDNGVLVLDSDGTFSYVPEDGFIGQDTFVYVLCDTALCDTAVVIINVVELIPIPDAVDDYYLVVENGELTHDVSINDVNTQGFIYNVIIPPANGTITMAPDGTFSYTPDQDFVGLDSLTYNACDDLGNCYGAWVYIVVEDDPSNNDTEVHVPGGFSPNNDGIGDTFIIENIDLYPNNNVVVFNRWGNVVYQRDGYSNLSAWDGTSEALGVVIGSLLPEGTYFYVLDKGDGSPELKGFIVLKYDQK
jgi:gliding motility-associated-like protein